MCGYCVLFLFENKEFFLSRMMQLHIASVKQQLELREKASLDQHAQVGFYGYLPLPASIHVHYLDQQSGTCTH